MATPISLILTTYNRERYLGAAIDSVLAQTHGDLELVLWDDGSTDRSVALARDYARRDARVRVIAAPHQGRAPALKAACAQASGTYVGLVDSDDLLAPTALAETVAVLDAHPAVGMVYTDYLDIDAHGTVLGYGQRCRLPYSTEGLLLNFMTFHFRLMRHAVLKHVGGFNASFACAQDYDLCLRLSEVTEVRHLAQPLYAYRVHPAGISQQQAVEQSRCAYRAIKAALQRRGLAPFLDLTFRLHKLGQHVRSLVSLRPRPQARRRFPSRVVQTLAALAMFGAVGITPAWGQAYCGIGVVCPPEMPDALSIQMHTARPIIPTNSRVQNGHVLTHADLDLALTHAGAPAPGQTPTLESSRGALDQITQPPQPTDTNGATTASVDTRDQSNPSTITSNVQTTQPAVITWLPADYQSQFRLSCYVISNEADFLDSQLIDHVRGLPPNNRYHEDFLDDVRLQGSGQALDGTIIGYVRRTRSYELRRCALTASGRCAEEGVAIAVDPDVIPLRSSVNVAILGDRTAQDTGGRIVGYRIDEYMGPHRAQCLAFGDQRRSNVTFLRY